MVNYIMAIDPGSTKSAWVVYDRINKSVVQHQYCYNPSLLLWLSTPGDFDYAIEYPRARGEMLYNQLIDTIYWIGRFDEMVNGAMTKIDRKDVKMVLLGTCAGVGDKHVRTAVINSFPATGGGKLGQIGLKKSPGPLYGISGDVWSALAVALTYADMINRF